VVELTEDRPYLSVVVASRNDMHGGDPLARLQALVNSFSAQCLRFRLSAELIVVEWNPPADRPRLSRVVGVPESCALALRFVEVPPDLHGTLSSADRLPLFQMIAKNVGIRRARGRFVLSTNIDIIFSNELVEYLAARRLERGRLYRLDRHDIESDFPIAATLDQQMTYCAGHQLRVHARGGTYAVNADGTQRIRDEDVVGPGVAIGSGWHVREGDAQAGFYRWAASDEAHLVIDRGTAAGSGAETMLELVLASDPYDPRSWAEIEIFENSALLAGRRVSRATSPVVRFCVVLENARDRHDVVLRLRGASSEGRAFQPLFERRLGLAYRLMSARLRDLPLRAALSHSYSQGGALQPQKTDTYHFAWQPTRESETAPAIVDEPTGEPIDAQVDEIFDHGTRMFVVSVELRRFEPVWLRTPIGDPGVLHGSVEQGHLRPSLGLRAIASWARIGTLRASRAFRRIQRRTRSAAVPWLRQAVQRFDPVAEKPVPPSTDDLSGTTLELSQLRDFLRANRTRPLHQNACGDFQLMALEDWVELRGFAEFTTYSMSLDGLLSASADAAGIQEYVLDMPICIYHLEHEKGSGWTPEGEALLRQRIAERGITWVDHRVVEIWSAYMTWLKRPMIFNGSDWGFGAIALPETTFQPIGDRI
jgi:hypothetical protein